jgi:hypothetical protein
MNSDDVMGDLPDAVAIPNEIVEMFETWVKSHPDGLNDSEMLPGLMAIAAQAVLLDRRLDRRQQCWRLLRMLGACKQ